ncbi:MAG: hypothetical protein AB7Q42_23735, partial [Acidimicrobiia bacterium]
MRRFEVVAMLAVAALSACGSSGIDGGDGISLETLLPPPTAEVQDPVPETSPPTSDVASAAPTLPATPTTPFIIWATDDPIGGGDVPATTTAPPATTAGTTTTPPTTTTSTAVPPTTAPPTTALRPQTISFPDLVGQWAYGEPRSIAATASSGLPVSYDTNGACVVENAQLGVVRAKDVGSCSITVSQPGGDGWGPAAPFSRSITISKAKTVIHGFADASAEHPRSPFSIPLSAAASSGAVVGYRTVPDGGGTSLCTLKGATLQVPSTAVLPRICTVEASAGVSPLFEATTAVARFTITPTVVDIKAYSVVSMTDTVVSVSVTLN